MRFARFALALAGTCLVLAPLTGCVISDRSIYPTGTAAVGISKVPQGPAYDETGSTLFDAYHAVQRYLSLHYPNAQLVQVQASMVGTNARIDQSSQWAFTYRVQVQNAQASPAPVTVPVTSPAPVASPTPATTPSPTPVPTATPASTASATYKAQGVVATNFQYHLLKFVYTGTGQLLAPEETDDTGDTLATVDFERAILLDQAISTARDIGMQVGAPGMAVTLRTTVNGGAVYELDNSVATRQAQGLYRQSGYGSYDGWNSDPNYGYGGGYDNGRYDNGGYDNGGYDNGGYDNSTYPTPAPTPNTYYVRGKYLIDAYTGAIIDRPSKL